MREISSQELATYRARTFHLTPSTRLKSQEEAVSFVNERGFVFFWPISGVVFPSLWSATAGDRPVADAHDDPGHVTWGWKDALLGSRLWYYAKVLRRKSTMISFDLLPHFYALSENYGAFEEDYLTLYEQGRMTMEARQMYEALLDHGILDTIALKRKTHLSSPASESRFNKAITDLQCNFMILPVGVTESGAWHYAFAYDIAARHYPELPDLAHKISEDTARTAVIKTFSRSMGVFELQEAVRLLGWRREQVQSTVMKLIHTRDLVPFEKVAGKDGEWIVDSGFGTARNR
jgi:hypothetical protein